MVNDKHLHQQAHDGKTGRYIVRCGLEKSGKVVVWDAIAERVCSRHKTLDLANARAAQLNAQTARDIATSATALFAGVYPAGIVYADRRFEIDDDYKRCAFLSFSTLELTVHQTCSPDLRERIVQDAAKIQARRGEQYEVSAVGQTVTLGG